MNIPLDTAARCWTSLFLCAMRTNVLEGLILDTPPSPPVPMQPARPASPPPPPIPPLPPSNPKKTTPPQCNPETALSLTLPFA